MGKHSGNCERSRLSSPCRVQGSRGGSAAEHRVSKVCAAVKPAFGGLPSSVTVRRKSAAPRHLPQGEGKAAPPQSTEFQRCVPRLSPPLAGCPHPSRCGAKAQHRATFPKGKARRLCRRARNLPRRGKAFPKRDLTNSLFTLVHKNSIILLLKVTEDFLL